MRRTWLFCLVVALCPVTALVAWRYARAQGDKPDDPQRPQPAKKLPLTQVVLFNTGLGYFQREGEVEGDVRIDLAVPTDDVNDLLMTMLVENDGKPFSVTYQGNEPIDHKLSSFSLDLLANPSLADLLMQARGERVEVTFETVANVALAPITGSIVGVESPAVNPALPALAGDSGRLVVHSADGLRRAPIDRIQRVRFLDSNLEEEFRRALGVLAAGRAEQRRVVSVHLSGEGKRKVRIGYVAESPVWKATYRLVLGEKPSLQGFGLVENTTEEDWNDVRVVLVSGRPVTFRMDLAQQLFVPRPTVEPEIYASLRPPTFRSADDPTDPRLATRNANLGVGGGAIGQLGQLGQLGGVGPTSRMVTQRGSTRLSYDEYQQRRTEAALKRKQEADQAREMGTGLSALGAGIDDVVVNAERLGEGFRYVLEQRVRLPRQRSAMLPLPGGDVSAARLSVYAPGVHPRFPMQAARLKNATGRHLMQGPVTVYEAGQFVGTAQLPDMQPGQERLVSFALDQGVEVRPEQGEATYETSALTLDKGVVTAASRLVRRTSYRLWNRSNAERVLLVEHPASNHKLDAESERPAETTRGGYRFEWKVPAGKVENKAVVETVPDSERAVRYDLAVAADAHLHEIAASPKVGPAVEAAVGKVRAERRRVAGIAKGVEKATADLREADEELKLVTTMLGKLPAGSDSQKRYLAEFERVDPQVRKLRLDLRERTAALAKAREESEATVRGLSQK